MLIGVLALQGNFAKHEEMIRSLGVEVKQVRTPQDLEACDALIIPGGESTVMMRQLEFIRLKQPLSEFARHKPLFGTCAGLILMSSSIQASSMVPFGVLDVTVERNAFGRQVESFQASINLELEAEYNKLFRAFFIRAPRIRDRGEQVQVLASYKGEAILVRQGHHLGASFHPELTGDPTIHQYFLNLVRLAKENRREGKN